MTEEEFQEKIKVLFDGFLISRESHTQIIPDYNLTKNLSLKIDKPKLFYYVYNKEISIYKYEHFIYSSPSYDDYEQFYDEMIIFKELILPKLIQENA